MSLTCRFCQSRTEEVIALRRVVNEYESTIAALKERIRCLEPSTLPPPPLLTIDSIIQARTPTYDTRPAHMRR